MGRRTGRSLPAPWPGAPNRSGDGAPAPVHGRLGSRFQSAGTGAGEHGLGGRLEEDAHGVQPLGGSAESDRERERAMPVGPERRTRLLAVLVESEPHLVTEI